MSPQTEAGGGADCALKHIAASASKRSLRTRSSHARRLTTGAVARVVWYAQFRDVDPTEGDSSIQNADRSARPRNEHGW